MVMQMTTTQIDKRSNREKRKSLGMIGTAVCLVVYGAFLSQTLDHAWAIWLAIAAAVAMVLFAVVWVAALDEAAQQAHYVAWYWGGSAGLAISVLVFLALLPTMLNPVALEAPLARLPVAMGTSFGFLVGFVLGVVPATLGYVIWWVAVWMRRG